MCLYLAVALVALITLVNVLFYLRTIMLNQCNLVISSYM